MSHMIIINSLSTSAYKLIDGLWRIAASPTLEGRLLLHVHRQTLADQVMPRGPILIKINTMNVASS